MSDSLAWQTHLIDATTDDTFLLNQVHVNSNPNPGQEDMSKNPRRIELGALTEGGKTLGVRSFYRSDIFYCSASQFNLNYSVEYQTLYFTEITQFSLY